MIAFISNKLNLLKYDCVAETAKAVDTVQFKPLGVYSSMSRVMVFSQDIVYDLLPLIREINNCLE